MGVYVVPYNFQKKEKKRRGTSKHSFCLPQKSENVVVGLYIFLLAYHMPLPYDMSTKNLNKECNK
jgi:hypothetical protein